MKQKTNPAIFSFLLFITFFFLPWGVEWGAAQYCIPQFTSPCSSNDFLDGVQFAGISNSSTGCNGNTNNYIFDISDTAWVLPGNSYPVTLTPSPQWQQGIGVWIDFNHDFDFADSGEFVLTTPPGTFPVSDTITIPFPPYSGITVIRFRAIYATTPAGSDSCSIQTFGETEDYPIFIISPANNIGVFELVTPRNACGLTNTEVVSVRIKNFGYDTLAGFPVSYVLNYDTVTEAAADTLYGPDTILFSFSATVDLSSTGNFTIVSFTALPGDAQPSNDGVTRTITHKASVTAFPFLETFESFTVFNSGNPGTPPLNLVNNWDNDQDDDGLDWAPRSSPTITTLTGPDYDHTYGNDGNENIGKFIYVEDNFNADPVNLISPCFDVAAVNNPYLGFWYHTYNGQDTSKKSLLHVDIFWQDTWINDIVPVIGPSSVNQWIYTEANLNPYKGVITLRFRVDNDNGYSFTDVAIDDVSVFNKIPTDGDINPVLLSEEESMMIYPNPVSNKATVRLNFQGMTDETASFRIFNVAGEIVLNRNVVKSQDPVSLEIDLNTYADGLYCLQLVTGEKVYTRKLIITN